MHLVDGSHAPFAQHASDLVQVEDHVARPPNGRRGGVRSAGGVAATRSIGLVPACRYRSDRLAPPLADAEHRIAVLAAAPPAQRTGSHLELFAATRALRRHSRHGQFAPLENNRGSRQRGQPEAAEYAPSDHP